MSKKKISEWLSELPDEYKKKAVSNFNEQEAEDKDVTSLANAVGSGFLWNSTPEGTDYWYSVYNELGGLSPRL